MSIDPTPSLRSLFEAALNEFEKRAGTNLVQHQIIDRLGDCESAESVIDVLREQAQAFHEFRGEDSRIMTWLKRTVHVLHTLSITGVLGEAIGLPFPPAKAIFAGFGILLTAIKDISGSYDTLVELFETFESFLRRLDIYTRMPHTTAMTEVIIKIIVELLATLALATQQAKQGRLKKFGKRLLGENDVEAVLQRLDRLTQEEARTTATQSLEVICGIVKNIKVIMDGGRSSTNEIHQTLVLIQQLASDINRSRRDQQQENFRRWLSPADPSKNYNIARKAHHQGSTEWFVHSNTFFQWRTTTGSLLWIHGKPGAGKSVLSSTIIEDISRMGEEGLASVAFYYFDFRDATKQDARHALSSLVTQLAAQSDACCDILSRLYSIHYAGSKEPSEDALRECLKKMLTLPEQGPTFIIIDALDECLKSINTPSPQEGVLDLVQWLVELRYVHLHICVTSRLEADIDAVLQPLASYTMSLHDQDGQIDAINNYITFFINSDPITRKWRREDRELVIEKLSENADGMFRWVFCQLDKLRRCLPQRIRKALDELPDTLDKTYERTLLDINEENWAYAYRLFQCMTVAFRPLDVEELAEFLAFDFEAEGCPSFQAGWRSENPRNAVLSTCSSLITIVDTGTSQVVQFSHYSVKEYLTSNRIAKGQVSRFYIPLEPAHILVTQACLSVLLELDTRLTKERIEDFPLAEYAAGYWVHHAKFDNVSLHAEDAMKHLFNPRAENPHFSAWIWIYDVDFYGRFRSMISDTPSAPAATPLYYAALCDFHRVAEWLVVTCSQNVNAGGGDLKTPLFAAASVGCLKVVEVLLNLNADVNALGYPDLTPLHGASMFGRLEACRLLLKFGADVDAKSRSSKTPLYLALQEGHAEVAKLLLEHGADRNAQNEDGMTLLHLASRRGNVKVVERLLELGAWVHVQDNRGRTPLQVASRRKGERYADVVQLILDHDAEMT